MTFYDRIMAPPSFWSEKLWEVFAACLYWNGFPRHLNYGDLLALQNHSTGSKKEMNKITARIKRVKKMHDEVRAKILENSMQGECIEKSYYITPCEFVRYAAARNYHPFDLGVIIDELTNSSCQNRLDVLHAFKKRSPPALATSIPNRPIKNGRLPKCNCQVNGKHANCCIHRFLSLQGKNLHRKQVKECAIKVDLDCQMERGRKATPCEIYRSPTFQNCLKGLRSPIDPDVIEPYDRSLILKNWIPQAIGKREKGRPRIKKRRNAKESL